MFESLCQNSKLGRSHLRKIVRDNKILSYVCQICENDGKWKENELRLELDHINGIRTDNRVENLRYLCPNCHSQQPTSNCVKGKNQRKIQEQEIVALFKECSNIREILLKLNLSDASANYRRIRKLAEKYEYHFGGADLKIEKNIPWKNAPRPSMRKVDRPGKEILEKLVWKKPTSLLAKDYGVSDKSIEKWCKSYGISKPPRGYWIKCKRNGPDYESESA